MGLEYHQLVFLSKSKRKLIILVRQNKENIVITYVIVAVIIPFSKISLATFGASKYCTSEYIKNPVATIISRKASPL